MVVLDAKRKPSRVGKGGTGESRISALISDGQLRTVFQPIVDMTTGAVFAYESLARTTAPDIKSPPHMFDTAIEEGMCGRLGRRLRELSVEGCADAPLFLNIHPNEFDEPWLVQPDDPIFGHDHEVFLEITESVPLSHFELCTSILREIRGKGVNLVVDDLGAGYSNLKYIADLTPEVVKLDRELIAGLASAARLQKLVRAIVRLCEDLGASVVAEGIETEEELGAVRDAGVRFGQGYYLARPNSPPPIPREVGPGSANGASSVRKTTPQPAKPQAKTRTVPPKAPTKKPGRRQTTRF